MYFISSIIKFLYADGYFSAFILAGLIVGFFLSLTGSGGSILSIPLIMYFTSMSDMHLIVGITALSVALNAILNVIPHAKNGNVVWRSGVKIGMMGAVGAFFGTMLGKIINANCLMGVFSIVMMFVSLKIFTKQTDANGWITENCTHSSTIRSWLLTLLAGGLSGLLGIGGGFLVVPLLVDEFHFSMVKAIATSLLIISFMGSITALSYSFSHPIDINYVMWLIIGGAIGGWSGASVVNRLKKRQRLLNIIFASMLLSASIYFLLRVIHVI